MWWEEGGSGNRCFPVPALSRPAFLPLPPPMPCSRILPTPGSQGVFAQVNQGQKNNISWSLWESLEGSCVLQPKEDTMGAMAVKPRDTMAVRVSLLSPTAVTSHWGIRSMSS